LNGLNFHKINSLFSSIHQIAISSGQQRGAQGNMSLYICMYHVILYIMHYLYNTYKHVDIVNSCAWVNSCILDKHVGALKIIYLKFLSAKLKGG
jgi:hypothetical protein